MWNDDWDSNGMMNGSTYGGAWMMVLLSLILVAGLALTVVLAMRMAGPRHFEQRDTGRRIDPVAGSPRDALDQRLARGEISEEEYRAARSLLGP